MAYEKERNENEVEESENDINESGNEKLQNIKEVGSTAISEYKSEICTITIIGQIEGHMVANPQTKTTKYEHIIPQLVAIEENPNIKGLLVLLNTVGGDVEAGLAISEMIKSISKPTVSLVVGGGHSIGVPLAVSTDYSFITPTATMTVHPIRMNGLILGVPQTFEYFSKMQERIVNFVVKNSKISREDFNELMLRTGDLLNDMGTILIGQQAVDIGLINSIGGLSEAINKVKELISKGQMH